MEYDKRDSEKRLKKRDIWKEIKKKKSHILYQYRQQHKNQR